MSKQQHTPGPWMHLQDGRIVTVDPNGWEIADFRCDVPDFEANARLIAAAPDLLEALEAANLLLRTQRHACESTDVCHVLDSHIKRNNVALAKARGES